MYLLLRCVCVYIYIYTQVHLKQLEYGEKVTCKVKHFKVFFVLILMIRANESQNIRIVTFEFQ